MVLSAAEAIVIEEGGGALTVRKIAMRVGYTVGSIYMVFDNMADVICHVNAKTLEHIATMLKQQQPQDLHVLGRAYLDYAHQNHHRWRLLSDTGFRENGCASEAYQASADALINLIESSLASTNNPNLSNPNVNDPTQKSLLARTLWAGMQGVCANMLDGGTGSVKAAEASMHLLTTLFCGTVKTGG